MASKKVQSFVDQLAPAAIAIGAKYGIDPGLILSQSALETGWGDSIAGNNYFGVKSHGRPGGIDVATHEDVGGQMVPVTDSFRQYGGLNESMEDYARFLQDNPRYRNVFEQDTLPEQIDAVAAAGYASDRDYAAKLHAISNMFDLSAYQPAQPAPVAPTPAVRAIETATVPIMKPAQQPKGGFFGNVMSGFSGLKTAALDALPTSAQIMRPGLPQSILSSALTTLPGRTAVFRYLMNQNVSPAPSAVPGHVAGGTQVMAVNRSGVTPMTLMRAASGRGGESSRSFDNSVHAGQNMDTYRANREAIGGTINQDSIDRALSNGSTLYRLA